jgi:IS5 family transposase
MRQATLTSVGFERFGKKTRRAAFLAEMDQVVPWKDLCQLIEPVYPKAGNGRPPVGVERMPRIYFLQQWFNLSDPAVEEALYDSLSMRGFAGIDLGREPVPDETTVCKFRHLLEQHDLGRALFEQVHVHLEARGVLIAKGTIVEATIIHAPSSTKNASGAHDPDMHQTRKGQQWYFGMKSHIGVNSKTKVIHAVVATAANMHDATILPDLLQGENRTKSKVRTKVEHCFGVMKRAFGFTKVRYRGLEKNAHRLFVTCALINLLIVRKPLLRA